ncbi:MAG: HAD family hydrolase [Balneolaceae bacterium]|nr:HAD family hydrolase [Balneolaceae bacterium]
MARKNNELVTIDFWNTLVKAEAGGEQRREVRLRALRQVAAEHDTELTIDDISRAKREASKKFDKIWFAEQRTPTSEELVNTIISHLGIPAGDSEKGYLIRQFEESLWEGPPELSRNAREVIENLSGSYRLGLISDTMYSPGRVLRRYLENQGLLDFFEGFVFSDETGFSKPNPRAFKKLLDSHNCNPARSWHIGDLMETDIKGAKNLGMNAILFTGHYKGRYNSDIEIDAEPDHVCETWVEVSEVLL